MVFKFLRGGDTGMESVERMVTTMLGDCRHSFDVAMAALTAGDDVHQQGVDVRETDRRINAMEEQVRRALVVHVAVQGGTDVGLVMTYLLLVTSPRTGCGWRTPTSPWTCAQRCRGCSPKPAASCWSRTRPLSIPSLPVLPTSATSSTT